ncbi:maleylpyruvate isomerase family mycothiol-dependent enzyme [Mycobacterium sp. B14F4]|uniref:maleylpyruvate isomerase family mycothiol-dependent enzyme n=1 Tax=Mycobacterium sp. B14F4 TaxID=3153565 RepID=UPI00325E3FB7
MSDWLRSNDIRFCELARTLSVDEWAHPSLCDAWSNQAVLAHLVVGYRTGVTATAAAMLRQRGSFDRANAALAWALAETIGPAALIDEFERLIDRPRVLGRVFPRRLLLGDHITHELDILFALGRAPAIPFDALAAVLDTQVSLPNPFVPAYRNSRGLRLRAADTDWSHGSAGPVVEGRAADLVSVLGNRTYALHRLRGDGVDELASRLSLSRIRKDG